MDKNTNKVMLRKNYIFAIALCLFVLLFDYEILPKFNGKNSKNDLVKELINFEKNGKFHFVIEEKIVKNEKKIEQMAEKYINDKINMLNVCGLLV